MKQNLTICIPTANRPLALGITLTSLIAQTYNNFDVVISDQSDVMPSYDQAQIQTVIRALELRGVKVRCIHHIPAEGIAENRNFLLEKSDAPFTLFLDDDVLLENYVVEQMISAIAELKCGFVGSALIGLSFVDDVRPSEQNLEWWGKRVEAEHIVPDSREWQRHKLHNAANIYHVQKELPIVPPSFLPYKVAWIGGCVLYDTQKLRNVDGFSFWKSLPQNVSGEDVLAQLRVMKHYGGCGVMPSGAYHLEMPTTIPDRSVNAARLLSI